MLKTFSIFTLIVILSIACSTKTIADENEPFTLKKNESKNIGNFKVKMISVGHTFGEKGGYVYADLEISEKEKAEKITLKIGETKSLDDKFLKLQSVNEKADPKLSDPFAATSCTLLIVNIPNERQSPTATETPTPNPTSSRIKPTLIKVKNAKIKLGFGKKSAIIDLDEMANVTLGGESNHRYKLHFATVKADKIYYLFEVQSGAAMSNPSGFCGGDSPKTLVWLKTDLDLKIEDQNSEVFASCAYNGGRYLIGKIDVTKNNLKIVFEQQRKKTEIIYDNSTPEKGFEVKEKL